MKAVRLLLVSLTNGLFRILSVLFLSFFFFFFFFFFFLFFFFFVFFFNLLFIFYIVVFYFISSFYLVHEPVFRSVFSCVLPTADCTPVCGLILLDQINLCLVSLHVKACSSGTCVFDYSPRLIREFGSSARFPYRGRP